MIVTNKNLIEIECGPNQDRRKFLFHLPYLRKKISVMVSGGLDSALVYYLTHKINYEGGKLHKIQPYIVLREEGSQIYGPRVIDYVHKLFNVKTDTVIVGDTSLTDDKQVWSGIRDIINKEDGSVLFIGSIETMEEHTIGWRPPVKVTNSETVINPFINLYKSHIVDIVKQLDQEELFRITHSCIHIKRCNICLSCQERAWGFEQMGLEDPGED